MLLLIDIGNTSIKIGLSRRADIAVSYTLPTDYVSQSSDILGLRLLALLAHAALGEEVRACIVSSVVPGMDGLIRAACRRFLHVEAVFAHQDVAVPLENRYESPAEVGADRLVAAYGARRLYPSAASLICADYGTATTFDCISAQAYLGGLICPGVMSALNALSSRTALLPRIALERDAAGGPVVGRNTTTSLKHGFLFGFASMTEGLCARLSADMPEPVVMVATGGFASAVAGLTPCIRAVHPDLILEGLRFLHDACFTPQPPD
jgi:type III pantothenate kinase